MLVTHLVGFHIFLSYHQLTTYNYVMQTQAQQEKAKEKYKEEEVSSEEESDEETPRKTDGTTADEEATVGSGHCYSTEDKEQIEKCLDVPSAIITEGGDVDK